MIGKSVKHYEVEESLGKGGMGVVYRARDTRLNRPVALKFLPEELTADPERRGRFLQEARAASAVNHPSIAQVYDVDEVDGGLFIAMELVEGKTVRQLIKARELDVLGAIEIAIQVGNGLAKAHEAGIVHRDIKAENIMVTPDGHAKILDFGLAKRLDTVSSGESSGDDLSHMETVARTEAGMILGTLRYMSPEQARGQAVDHRSDIFSLGVVLYEMVTGKVPFSGGTALDTLHAIAFEETTPVTALRTNLPSSLQRALTRCLRKRKEDRYPDVKELVSDLKGVQREVESGVSTAVPLGTRLREKLRFLGGSPGDSSFGPGGAPHWALVIAVPLGLVTIVYLVIRGDSGPFLVFLVGGGLLAYRRWRHRRLRLMRKFSTKVRKLPEVRIVALDGLRATVVADKALAKTYVRVHAAMDAINSSLFFGDPFSVVVRDGLTSEETRALLGSPGVLYVRPDVLEGEV